MFNPDAPAPSSAPRKKAVRRRAVKQQFISTPKRDDKRQAVKTKRESIDTGLKPLSKSERRERDKILNMPIKQLRKQATKGLSKKPGSDFAGNGLFNPKAKIDQSQIIHREKTAQDIQEDFINEGKKLISLKPRSIAALRRGGVPDGRTTSIERYRALMRKAGAKE